jgi:site-specific recombinase XerD
MSLENTSFTKTINDYISYKRALGYNARGSYQKFFISLGGFLSRYLTTTPPVLNFEMVNDYIFQGNGKNKPRTIHNRMSAIRQLAIFMNMTNPGNYVFPEERIIKVSKGDFIPYIFTHEEIMRLDASFASIPTHNWAPFRPLVYPMLFRVLYCTGLRVSEALNLLLTDVDLENGILLIRKPKNNRDRLVPMSLSLWEAVKKYYLAMGFPTGNTIYFLPTAKGNNYNPVSLTRTFKQLYRDCGIFTSKGNLPRIHDLRHTFCTHALEQMVEQGTDVYCAIAYLCEYVGHRDISSTNAYLRLLPERFSDITKQMQEYCPALIPEVQND